MKSAHGQDPDRALLAAGLQLLLGLIECHIANWSRIARVANWGLTRLVLFVHSLAVLVFGGLRRESPPAGEWAIRAFGVTVKEDDDIDRPLLVTERIIGGQRLGQQHDRPSGTAFSGRR